MLTTLGLKYPNVLISFDRGVFLLSKIRKDGEKMAGGRMPIDLVIARGKKNLTKAEIEKRREEEVTANSDDVRPPDSLPERLIDDFNYYAEQLLEIGIMTNLDCEALGRYLIAQDNYVKISDQMDQLDLSDEDDLMKFDKLTNMQTKFFTQARQGSMDLGLSISGRAKLVVPTKKEEPKELTPEEKLFGARLG